MLDTTNKEGTQYVETLIPVDYEKNGPVLADELYKDLVCAMPSKVTFTCVMDCCHGGSVIHLPYLYTTGDTYSKMYYDDSFDFAALIGLAIIGGVLVGAGTSGDGGDATGGGGGGGGRDGGNADGNVSSDGDDCCGGCCECLSEGLFD
jgi:hypothetical protein